ncbi:inactive hydroxysteroid dehydrogenase-like protein 1 [Bicyclus anynana]|uniref:Inactive hydroxysteroid dehydrogenase-like protein 1 n=1 Tax=Bicyclus anynana TaxID=110368 RepID=A0A6J1N7W7_BICAN|nr:inactive hydroxysteroid dehydrogenase-like protein 1 [Bicyclus anynana]
MLVVYALAVIGAIVVAAYLIDSLWSVLEMITSYLMPYFLPAEVLPLAKRFGPWAVITGSTDGIGKQYALELAQRGLNVVLISRNPDKLKSVAEEIEKLHSVKTKTIVADFAKGTEVYEHIEKELKDIPIGILVNNVGKQYDYPMPLCEIPATQAWEIINVNVVAVTSMTRMVLPAMVARGRGAVVNVSSGSELQPLPLMAVYAATKVYVRNFTFAVREEYAPQGIHVQHVSPLFVSTKMNTFSQRLLDGNLLVPDAKTYTRYAICTLGRVQTTTGYWLHGIQYLFIKLAPEWIRIKIGAHMNRGFREEHMQNVKIKAQ